MSEDNEESLFVASAALLTDPAAVGVSGLPILQEIGVAISMLVLTSILIRRCSLAYLKDDSGNQGSESEFPLNAKHYGLPAFVLTAWQQKQISKLLMPLEGEIQKFCPLLVFVNTKSGGQTGKQLLARLRQLLRPEQVFDLIADRGPKRGFQKFSRFFKFKVLVCGGDGSITWVLNEMEAMKITMPVGIMPLGTGNDVSRVLGWGSGVHSWDLVDFLIKMQKSRATNFDRWDVKISDLEAEYKNKLERLQKSGSELNKLADKKSSAAAVAREANKDAPGAKIKSEQTSKILSGYLGVGVDAQICLNFHRQRESKPYLFTSQLINKFWYASSGGKEILMQRFLDFYKKVSLVCDGKRVPIPLGIEGLIVCNIRSYGGGVDLWGEVEEDDDMSVKTSRDDGDTWGLGVSTHTKSPLGRRRRSTGNVVNFQQLLNEKQSPDASMRKNWSAMMYASEDSLDLEPQTKFNESRFDDGILEVVGVQSSFELAASQVGLAKPRKLCQGRHLLIHISDLKDCPIQIDGEPFVLKEESLSQKITGNLAKLTGRLRSASTDTSLQVDNDIDKIIEIKSRGKAQMLTTKRDYTKSSMRKRSNQDDEHLNFENVLSWGVDSGTISMEQRSLLRKQFARLTEP